MMLLPYPLQQLVFQTSLNFDMILPVPSSGYPKVMLLLSILMLIKSKLLKTLLSHSIPMAIMTTTNGLHMRTCQALFFRFLSFPWFLLCNPFLFLLIMVATGSKGKPAAKGKFLLALGLVNRLGICYIKFQKYVFHMRGQKILLVCYY